MQRRSLRRAAVGGLVVYLGAVAAYINLTQAEPKAATRPAIPPAAFKFDPSFPRTDRAWVTNAVGRARPAAQRLIRQASSRTSVEPGRDEGAAGLAYELTPGRYTLRLNLDVLRRSPAITRRAVVMHELAHLVDFAVISDQLLRRMVAGIEGNIGPEEKFADTFAKWALRSDMPPGVGYGVPLPRSLEEWGAPLTDLAARLP